MMELQAPEIDIVGGQPGPAHSEAEMQQLRGS